MKTRIMNARVMIVAALAIGAALYACAQGAEDDALIQALNAEISGIDKKGERAAGKQDVGAKADAVLKALDAEISGLDEKGDGETSGKPTVSSSGQQRQSGKRPSKGSKGVIITSQGRGKTKAGAERAACCMAVVRALRIYAGEEAVKDKFDAVKERMKTAVNDVIEKHEVIDDEGQKDGQPVVKIKAWIKKKALAPKFADIFPEAFEGVEAEASSPGAKAASSGRTSASPSVGGQGGERRRTSSKDLKEVTVTVTGKGETKEEAKLAAFRAAVEKAVGVWVDAESLMQNSEMLKDRVNTISNADIKRCETIKEGRMKSGLYACQIKAWVEKKAITPKFADVFPAAFADVGEEASTIHVQKVTKAKRSGDAASLMTAELEGVDRMRNWVRLSVVKGKGLQPVEKIGSQEVNEVPGKGLYSVRYSMKINEDAYFKGFLPHFKEVLTKMQEGEAEEDVVLTSGPYSARGRPLGSDDGKSILMTDNGVYPLPPDLKPFCPYGNKIGNTYFVAPITLSGFPGVAPRESLGVGNSLGHGSFMFDRYDSNGCKIKGARAYNIWLLDKMNKDMTSVRCSAYKVPVSALQSYWKSLFGDVDSNERCSPKMYEKIEIVLLDGKGEEISARIDDHVPAMLIASGPVSDHCIDKYNSGGHRKGRCYWRGLNVFNSFFIRPMFVNYSHIADRSNICYSTEIQRDVYFPLTDAQLEKVKQVKVRFVGGKSRRE